MTLKWSIDQATSRLTFGKLIPMTGNTYDIQVSGQAAGAEYTFFVMDQSGEKCLARSERDATTGAYTIAFNQTELRRNFEKDWHEIRSFHTVVSDGTNTVAEGDLLIQWNPVWTDPGTGEAYSMRGPQGIQGERGQRGSDGNDGADGVGIRSIVFSHIEGDGGRVYVITLTNGASYDFKAPRGEKGVQGERGVQGEKGEQGIQGPMGDGSYIFDPEDQMWHNVTVYTNQYGQKVPVVNRQGIAQRPIPVSEIDDELDTTSEHPVQNKVIAGRIGGLETDVGGLQSDIGGIEEKIPDQATAENKLADKNFVNSSISTNTAFFRGTSAAGISEAQFLAWANGLTKTNNDYVFWNTTDSDGNVVFKRYKYNGTAWNYEYSLNNSSFTSDQWAAIQSGITSGAVEKLGRIEDGAEKNKIDSIKLNGEIVYPVNKTVEIIAKTHLRDMSYSGEAELYAGQTAEIDLIGSEMISISMWDNAKSEYFTIADIQTDRLMMMSEIESIRIPILLFEATNMRAAVLNVKYHAAGIGSLDYLELSLESNYWTSASKTLDFVVYEMN